MLARFLNAALFALLLGGCTRGQTPPAASPATGRPAAAGTTAAPSGLPTDDSTWTTGPTTWTPLQAVRTATLEAVRTGGHDRFDRTVFVFNDTLPGYAVEYIDAPVRQCGSGRTIPLAGDGRLDVRFTSARAHTSAGRPTVEDRARTPGLPVLRALKLRCDFEGHVAWTLGLAAPSRRYRVFRLQRPARVVVDVHR